jgi:hypothetical protein
MGGLEARRRVGGWRRACISELLERKNLPLILEGRMYRVIKAVMAVAAITADLSMGMGQVRSLLDKRVGAAVIAALVTGALRVVNWSSSSSRIAFN